MPFMFIMMGIEGIKLFLSSKRDIFEIACVIIGADTYKAMAQG